MFINYVFYNCYFGIFEKLSNVNSVHTKKLIAWEAALWGRGGHPNERLRARWKILSQTSRGLWKWPHSLRLNMKIKLVVFLKHRFTNNYFIFLNFDIAYRRLQYLFYYCFTPLYFTILVISELFFDDKHLNLQTLNKIRYFTLLYLLTIWKSEATRGLAVAACRSVFLNIKKQRLR